MSIDHDPRAGLREALGDRGPDAAAAAGDAGDAAAEPEEALHESGRDLEVGGRACAGWFR